MTRSWQVFLEYRGDVDEARALDLATMLTDELLHGVGAGMAGCVSVTFTAQCDAVAEALQLDHVVALLQRHAPGVRWTLVEASAIDHAEVARRDPHGWGRRRPAARSAARVRALSPVHLLVHPFARHGLCTGSRRLRPRDRLAAQRTGRCPVPGLSSAFKVAARVRIPLGVPHKRPGHTM